MRSLFVFYLDSFGHTGWYISRASERWIASKAPLIFSVKNVCGGSPCQFDRIPNHNKNKPLETMGSFWLGWDGKIHPKYGQFHSVGWGPGPNEKETLRWVQAFVSLCFLTADVMQSLASGSCCHDIPTMQDCTLMSHLPVSLNEPFLPQDGFVVYFVQAACN